MSMVDQDYRELLEANALIGFNPSFNLMYLIPALEVGAYFGRDDGIYYNACAHHHIVDKVYSEGSPNIFDLALFHTPMATVTHLDTYVDTGEKTQA